MSARVAPSRSPVAVIDESRDLAGPERATPFEESPPKGAAVLPLNVYWVDVRTRTIGTNTGALGCWSGVTSSEPSVVVWPSASA